MGLTQPEALLLVTRTCPLADPNTETTDPLFPTTQHSPRPRSKTRSSLSAKQPRPKRSEPDTGKIRRRPRPATSKRSSSSFEALTPPKAMRTKRMTSHHPAGDASRCRERIRLNDITGSRRCYQRLVE